MDFSFSEDQESIRALAAQIVGDLSTPERLKELEAGEERFDRKLWEELAKAGLLGLALPEDAGGAGLGLVELGLVLEEVGRHTAMVPVLPSIALGALPIARFGTAAQRAALLPGAADGSLVLTAALVDHVEGPVTAVEDDDGTWRLTGVRTCVPAGMLAHRILVPALDGPRQRVFVVDPASAEVTRERQVATDGLVEARVTLEGAAGDPLGTPDDDVATWILECGLAMQCVTMVGVCDRALRMTAEYAKTREQFGRPIATFQAVGQRAADAYIDTEAIRLTAWQAAWRLSEGLDASKEVAIAKFWAADGGQRVVHAAQHIHGGIGVDRDYPLHRSFLWAKHLELQLGGATAQLLRLGSMLAAEPADA